jgi:hypothetical protein
MKNTIFLIEGTSWQYKKSYNTCKTFIFINPKITMIFSYALLKILF